MSGQSEPDFYPNFVLSSKHWVVVLAPCISLLSACAPTAKQIAAEYPSACPAGAVATVLKNGTGFYKTSCKKDEVLEGPEIEVIASYTEKTKSTRIRVRNYHEGKLRGRMMDHDTQTSEYPNSDHDLISEWEVGDHGRHVGTEIHKSFLDGEWQVSRHAEWGPDGRLLSLTGTWRILNFPNGTGSFQFTIGHLKDEITGACLEGLRDGVWIVKRGDKILNQHSWKKGIADGEFILGGGQTRGMMRDGHRIGKWQESHGVGECILSTGTGRQACVVATAPVKFVAVYDDKGRFIEHQDIVWETSETKDGKKLTKGDKLPSPPSIHVDLEYANCDELTDAASAVNLGMD